MANKVLLSGTLDKINPEAEKITTKETILSDISVINIGNDVANLAINYTTDGKYKVEGLLFSNIRLQPGENYMFAKGQVISENFSIKPVIHAFTSESFENELKGVNKVWYRSHNDNRVIFTLDKNNTLYRRITSNNYTTSSKFKDNIADFDQTTYGLTEVYVYKQTDGKVYFDISNLAAIKEFDGISYNEQTPIPNQTTTAHTLFYSGNSAFIKAVAFKWDPPGKDRGEVWLVSFKVNDSGILEVGTYMQIDSSENDDPLNADANINNALPSNLGDSPEKYNIHYLHYNTTDETSDSYYYDHRIKKIIHDVNNNTFTVIGIDGWTQFSDFADSDAWVWYVTFDYVKDGSLSYILSKTDIDDNGSWNNYQIDVWLKHYDGNNMHILTSVSAEQDNTPPTIYLNAIRPEYTKINYTYYAQGDIYPTTPVSEEAAWVLDSNYVPVQKIYEQYPGGNFSGPVLNISQTGNRTFEQLSLRKWIMKTYYGNTAVYGPEILLDNYMNSPYFMSASSEDMIWVKYTDSSDSNKAKLARYKIGNVRELSLNYDYEQLKIVTIGATDFVLFGKRSSSNDIDIYFLTYDIASENLTYQLIHTFTGSEIIQGIEMDSNNRVAVLYKDTSDQLLLDYYIIVGGTTAVLQNSYTLFGLVDQVRFFKNGNTFYIGVYNQNQEIHIMRGTTTSISFTQDKTVHFDWFDGRVFGDIDIKDNIISIVSKENDVIIGRMYDFDTEQPISVLSYLNKNLEDADISLITTGEDNYALLYRKNRTDVVYSYGATKNLKANILIYGLERGF